MLKFTGYFPYKNEWQFQFKKINGSLLKQTNKQTMIFLIIIKKIIIQRGKHEIIKCKR